MVIGVVHGRFQPFHLHHLRYALAANEKCDHLIVGITNPDPSLTDEDSSDLNRSTNIANPLNYFERLVIVRESLLDAGLDSSKFDIVPFPINKPDLIKFYVPSQAIHFLAIYDEWGSRKLDLLRNNGFDTEVLWTRGLTEKGITASNVRVLIRQNQPWEHLLSKGGVRAIKSMRLDDKIRTSLPAGARSNNLRKRE